jgi:hypothetical protein
MVRTFGITGHQPAGLQREIGGTGEGSRSEVQGFRNFKPRISNFRIAPVSLGVPVSRVRGMGKGASLGKEAVLADSGRTGEESDFPSILLGTMSDMALRHEAKEGKADSRPQARKTGGVFAGIK